MESLKTGVDVQRRGPSHIEETPGIIVFDGPRQPEAGPKIMAFIWGGKREPVPTLPFGRWKGAA